MAGDSHKQQDHFAIKLQCGHPNVRMNEKCPLCGVVLLEDLGNGKEQKD